jgi:DNA-binding transcriptional LysR family regulator
VDLRHLQNLVYLADELHFGRAAKLAHLSQSAFTRSIQALEEEIGLALFDRNKRFVRITTVGKTTAQRARALLGGARDLARELIQIKTGSVGEVAIGGGPFSSGFAILPVLAQLQRAHPAVTVRLEITDGAVGIDRLKTERIDLLVSDIRHMPVSREVSVHPLGKFAGAFYCRTGHPLAKKRTIKGTDLRGYGLATVKLPPVFIDRMRKALGLTPGDGFPLGFECSCVTTLIQMARQSDLILIATPCAVGDLIASGEIKPLRIEGFDAEDSLAIPYGVVRMSGRTLSPAAELLFGMLMETKKRAGAAAGRSK